MLSDIHRFVHRGKSENYSEVKMNMGQEDPLEEGMVTHFSILTWRIPMDRGTWRATVHGVTKSQTQLKLLSMHACIHVVQPTCQSDLACTEMNMCLENTWFAVVKFVVSHIYKSISMLGIHNTEFKAGERTYSEIADI